MLKITMDAVHLCPLVQPTLVTARLDYTQINT